MPDHGLTPSTTDSSIPEQNQHLPGELWVSVFEHLGIRTCIPVTCVCKYWRELALGHSRLWTDITVEIGASGTLPGIDLPKTDEDHTDIRALVQKHLDCLPEPFDLTDHLRGPNVGGPALLDISKRSGSRPISLTLIFHEIDGNEALEYGVRGILDAHHERIISLAVFARWVRNVFNLLSYMRQPLSNLKELYIYSPLETIHTFRDRHGVTSYFANESFTFNNWRDLDRSFSMDRNRRDFSSPGHIGTVFPSLRELHLPRFYDIRKPSCDNPHAGITSLRWSTEGWSGVPCALQSFPNLRSLTVVLTMTRACPVEWPGTIDDTRTIVANLDHVHIINAIPDKRNAQIDCRFDAEDLVSMLLLSGNKTAAIEYSRWDERPVHVTGMLEASTTLIQASVAFIEVSGSPLPRLVFCVEDVFGRICRVTVPMEWRQMLRVDNPLVHIPTASLSTLEIPLVRVPDLFGCNLGSLLQLYLVMPALPLKIELAQVVDSWRGDDRVVAPALQELELRSLSLNESRRSSNGEIYIEAKTLEQVLDRLPTTHVLKLVGVRVTSA